MPPILPTNLSVVSNWYANRGTYDYSLAKGTRGEGCLTNGIRIADQGTGYRYFSNTDPHDSDNWGTLGMLNAVESVARSWHAYRHSYPLTTLDMSRQNGGSFPPHSGHTNGLDLDAMYVSTGPYQYGTFVLISSSTYDREGTYQLLLMFNNLPNVFRILTSDTNLANRSTTDKIQLLANHGDHFHVDFLDEDGTDNTCP
jgi:murein endopeptidase